MKIFVFIYDFCVGYKCVFIISVQALCYRFFLIIFFLIIIKVLCRLIFRFFGILYSHVELTDCSILRTRVSLIYIYMHFSPILDILSHLRTIYYIWIVWFIHFPYMRFSSLFSFIRLLLHFPRNFLFLSLIFFSLIPLNFCVRLWQKHFRILSLLFMFTCHMHRYVQRFRYMWNCAHAFLYMWLRWHIMSCVTWETKARAFVCLCVCICNTVLSNVRGTFTKPIHSNHIKSVSMQNTCINIYLLNFPEWASVCTLLVFLSSHIRWLLNAFGIQCI